MTTMPLVIVSNEGEEVRIKKRNPNFYILFGGKTRVSGNIEFRDSFLSKIVTDYTNGVHLNVFHAGVKMYPLDIGSFKIGSMEIFNEINHPEIIDHLMEFEANALINDTLLKDALEYSIFQLLSKFNADKPISAFFQKFSQALGKNIKKPRNVIQNEA